MKTNRKLVVAAILIATFLSAMEATIVSTAMPSIIQDLQGMEYVNLIFSIYLLIASVTTPIYGKLADMFGRKKILTLAILLFLFGSVLSGLSQTMVQLILFRAVQALGAGAVLPLTTTIIGDLFTTRELLRMQAVFNSVWAVSGVCGPLLGGFIVESLNWRWVFYINLPFGALSLLILWMSYHETFQVREKKPIDWAGIGAFLGCLLPLLYVLLFGSKQGFFSPLNLLLEAVFVVFLLIFLRIESKAADPFLPLSLFKDRFILIPNLYGFFSGLFMPAVRSFFSMSSCFWPASPSA